VTRKNLLFFFLCTLYEEVSLQQNKKTTRSHVFLSVAAGYVKNINGMIIAEVCNKLGAGRQFSDQRIDPAVGVCLTVKTGDRVERDDLCMVLHHNDDGGTTVDLTESLLGSIEMTDGIVEPEHIVLEVIVRDGR